AERVAEQSQRQAIAPLPSVLRRDAQAQESVATHRGDQLRRHRLVGVELLRARADVTRDEPLEPGVRRRVRGAQLQMMDEHRPLHYAGVTTGGCGAGGCSAGAILRATKDA